MSRGLGRVERLLLHAVYAHPTVAPNGDRFARPSDFAETDSQYSSLQRAARSLLRKGLVTGPSNHLMPLSECPVVSVQKCAESPLCEHIKAVHLRRAEKEAERERFLEQIRRHLEEEAELERRFERIGLKYQRPKHFGGEPA